MKTSPIIILATFWNEIDWVDIALKQIDAINPLEVILCDGCFDNNVTPEYSTDGTREILTTYVSRKKNTQLVSPVRTSRSSAFFQLFQAHNKLPLYHYLYPSRLFSSVRGMKKSQYRINQALTFNKMISLSKYWTDGRWFMCYDADQFYSDETIQTFFDLENVPEYCQIHAKERTFFTDFTRYTTEYEKRLWNNFPHKIYPNTIIVPTRDIYLEHFIERKTYKESCKSLYVGEYFHYKFTSRERFDMGYRLGDRKKPYLNNLKIKKMHLKDHPSLIQSNYKKLCDSFSL